MTDVIDKLNWRYATKKFNPAKTVPDDKLERILEAVRLAPTSSGLQPFELIVVSNPELRQQIVRGMVVLSLIDGEASPAEAALVEAYAKALGGESPALDALRHPANHSFPKARFDLHRRLRAPAPRAPPSAKLRSSTMPAPPPPAWRKRTASCSSSPAIT